MTNQPNGVLKQAPKSNVNVEDLVTLLTKYGMCFIPIPFKSKNPNKTNWTEIRLETDQKPKKEFSKGQHNVGLLLGVSTSRIIDIDLDCREARKLAKVFLPATRTFGRDSAPVSHYLYKVSPVPKTQTVKDLDGEMLVELRGKRHQTIVPPSVHPDGEVIRWSNNDALKEIEEKDLLKAFNKLACANLITRHYPKKGNRDETALALAGALLSNGWTITDTDTFIEAVAKESGDEEASSRRKAKATDEKRQKGEKVTGLPTLSKLLGKDLVSKIKELLNLRETNVDTQPPKTPDFFERLRPIIKKDIVLSDEAEQESLRKKPLVDANKLVKDLQGFFGNRLYLEDGASLILALFALNTYTYRLFSTVPYLFIFSAVNGCGKTVCLELLEEVVLNPRLGANFTEAVMARSADGLSGVTTLCDESGILNGGFERSADVINICLVGYRSDGKIYRCVEKKGKRFEEIAINVYGPRVFAGTALIKNTGLSDRFININMEMKPKGHVLKSTRTRALGKISSKLRAQCVDYLYQNKRRLMDLYDSEPDEGYWTTFENREADLWSTILLHARVAGVEQEALKVAVQYSKKKKEQKETSDPKIEKAIELIKVLERKTDTWILPSVISRQLENEDVWGASLESMKSDKGRVRSVGRFMSTFHGPPDRTTGRSRHNRNKLIVKIKQHLPDSNAENADLAKVTENKGTYITAKTNGTAKDFANAEDNAEPQVQQNQQDLQNLQNLPKMQGELRGSQKPLNLDPEQDDDFKESFEF